MEINLQDVFETSGRLFKVMSMELKDPNAIFTMVGTPYAIHSSPASLKIELAETTENHQTKNMDLHEVYVDQEVYDEIMTWEGVYEK